MGLTPLEGLVMGTRSGDLDPAICLYMQKARGLDADSIDHILNRESGLKGLCGSNDMRDLLARSGAGDDEAGLALNLYCYRIKKYIGAYTAALGGLDALIFTGGIGENAALVRQQICSGLEVLGIALDPARNDAPAAAARDIGQPDSPVRVLVIQTNEELQIAKEALEVVTATAG
jgi:acetate kinase